MDPVLVFSAVVMIAMSTALIMELAETAMIVFGTLLIFLLSGIVSVDEAFSGFSNPGMLSVGFLFVIAHAVYSTGVLNTVGEYVFKHPHESDGRRIGRLMLPVAGASAFMNNTPIVSMMIPMVKKFCRKLGISSSKILIPLSYAAILGGTCTLIGTSTNLVIHGFLLDRGYAGFGFFELSKIGIPLAVIGMLLVGFLLHRLLPERKDVSAELGENTREFVIELKVKPEYREIGKTIEEAGLRHLQGLFLFQIERDGRVIAPVTPEHVIQEEDRLFFTGLPSTIVELQKEPGLEIIQDPEFDLKNYDSNQLRTYEAVVAPSSELIGRTIRESRFRERYNGVILAIHRNGERIKEKIGNIRVKPGDTLLVLAPEEFYVKWYNSKDFSLVSGSSETASRMKSQSWLILGILATMITVVTLEIYPIVTAAATSVALLLATRCISIRETISAIDWSVLIVIASSLGIAVALENSGLAGYLAEAIVLAAEPVGMLGLIAAVVLVTMLYSEMITNNAAAAIIFPIVMSISISQDLDILPLAMAVTFGASAAFATPISYQTNLMVYGAGNYSYKDFLKIGIPMDLMAWVSLSLLIYLLVA